MITVDIHVDTYWLEEANPVIKNMADEFNSYIDYKTPNLVQVIVRVHGGGEVWEYGFCVPKGHVREFIREFKGFVQATVRLFNRIDKILYKKN